MVGAAIGGVIAQRWGVTAPFWFAFVGSAVFVVLIWRQLSHIAHDDELVPTVDRCQVVGRFPAGRLDVRRGVHVTPGAIDPVNDSFGWVVFDN